MAGAVGESKDYADVGQWVFFAITYDGAGGQNNVSFYKGSRDQPVYRVSTATLEGGTLEGGQDKPIYIACAGPAGQRSTAGFLDKFTVYGAKENDRRGALDLSALENLRRKHLQLPELITDALPGDCDLDGDVDQDDLSLVMTHHQAGPVRDYYWADVDLQDVNIARSGFTGKLTEPAIKAVIVSNIIKVHAPSDIPTSRPAQTRIAAARGEHEGFQIAITSKQQKSIESPTSR